MSAPLPSDWSQLLHTSVFQLQGAPELRSVQLDHVAEALAGPDTGGVHALPASVLEPSGQPGTLLPQFRYAIACPASPPNSGRFELCLSPPPPRPSPCCAAAAVWTKPWTTRQPCRESPPIK